ncbi:hypothetical protein MMC10_000470 [Thelotrema lepadinum]|nr:hypothetical protein [Thelotrema lepadinum]
MSSGSTSTKDIINKWGGNKRRSSAASSDSGTPKSPTRFAGLMNQKRASGDAGMVARRASWDEQKAAPGMLGGFWNKFTKGG